MASRLKLLWGRFTLPRRLERALPKEGLQVMARLADAGFEVGLVGGCVRDLLLGQQPKDWDMVTSARRPQILALFPDGHPMGAARGGETVLIARGGRAFEVTPYRGGTLLEDLMRRDFTCNAMLLGLDVTLLDPLGGQRDLRTGVLRACGDPVARLDEDPIRLLRAIRFAAQLNLALEPSLEVAVRAGGPTLAHSARERVGAEFGRLLVTDRAGWAMEQLRELGLLPYIAPELVEMVGVEQNRYHAYSVWEHSLMALVNVPPELHLRVAALLHDVGKPRTVSVDEQGQRHFYRHEQVGADMADAILESLCFDGETRRKVVHLVRYHMDLHFDGPVKDGAVRRMIARIGLEHMHHLVTLRRADRIASGTREGDLGAETVALLQQVQRLLEADTVFKVTDLAVTGNDVVRLFGQAPGPYVGRVLALLLDEVCEEPSRNDREWLLARIEALKPVSL